MLEVDTQMHGDATDNLLLDEPARRGSEMTFYNAKAELPRHRVEDERYIGVQAGAPAEAEAGARVLDPLQKRTVDHGRLVKRDTVCAGDDLYIRLGFAHESRYVHSRRACSEDGDLFAFE